MQRAINTDMLLKHFWMRHLISWQYILKINRNDGLYLFVKYALKCVFTVAFFGCVNNRVKKQIVFITLFLLKFYFFKYV